LFNSANENQNNSNSSGSDNYSSSSDTQGKIYNTKNGGKYELIGHYNGPDSGAAAAAYFLLLY
jgi:hypothetical protein